MGSWVVTGRLSVRCVIVMYVGVVMAQMGDATRVPLEEELRENEELEGSVLLNFV